MRAILLLVVMLLVLIQPVFAGGYDAGYEWAEEHGITDTSYDNGNSEEFNEGVRAYAEEQQTAQGESE